MFARTGSGNSNNDQQDGLLQRPSFLWLFSRLLFAFAIGAGVGAYLLFSALLMLEPSFRPVAMALIAAVNLLLIVTGLNSIRLFLERWLRYFWLPKAPPRVRGPSALLPPVPRDYARAVGELILEVCRLLPDLDAVARHAIRVRGALFVPPSVVANSAPISRLLAALLTDQIGEIRISIRPIRTAEEAEGLLGAIPEGVATRIILPVGIMAERASVIGRVVPALSEGIHNLRARGLVWVGRERVIAGFSAEKAGAVGSNGGGGGTGGNETGFLVRPDDLVYLPLIPISHVDFDPIPLKQALARSSRPSFYVGTSLSGPIIVPIHHLMIVGRTGSGKTTLARNLVRCAIHYGYRVVAYTPKGDGGHDLIPPELASDERIRVGLDGILAVQPETDERMVIFLDEAASILSENTVVKNAIARILRMGRAREVWGVLVSQSMRSEVIPIDLRQHQSLVVLPTDPGEIGYLERYYDASIRHTVGGLKTGWGVWVPAGNRVPVVFRFPGDVSPDGE